jgi:hypothetical protein
VLNSPCSVQLRSGKSKKWVSGIIKESEVLDSFYLDLKRTNINIQDVIESCTDILTTSYWLHVELGKNI